MEPPTLDRNIGSRYDERSLLPQHEGTVGSGMKAPTAPFDNDRMEFIGNPTVAEFIGLSPDSDFSETAMSLSFFCVLPLQVIH